MILAWMLGATVFTMLLGVAALAAERSLRALGRATRSPWVVAIIAGVVWPVLAPLWYRLLHSTATPALVVSSAPVSASAILTDQLPSMPRSWGATASNVAIACWVLSSALLLVRLLIAMRALNRLEQHAHNAEIDGEPVLITETVGPAVVGLLHPRVAVPQWLTQLDAPLRELVMRHEREHCRSRDPQLVWLAAVAVALMPWNVALWWLTRRLRLALEIDCDARTLRDEPNVERYGKLLLLIAQRQSATPLSTMLAESNSHLSRRITAMQMTPLRCPVARVVLFAAVATAAIAVACSPRIATDLTGPTTVASPAAIKSTSPGATFFEFQVEKPVTSAPGSKGPVYPDSLKALRIEGRVLAQFVVDYEGRAEPGTLKVLQSTAPAFTDAVAAALPNMRFEPAMRGGRTVKQLVQQPFMFQLGASNGALSKLSPAATSPKGATSVSARSSNGAPVAGTMVNGMVNFQLKVQATMAPGSAGPLYPAALKAQKIEGEVLAQFVVDSSGFVEAPTLKILNSSDDQFSDAVRSSLSTLRFNPARVDGRHVKQLIQQRFTFALNK